MNWFIIYLNNLIAYFLMHIHIGMALACTCHLNIFQSHHGCFIMSCCSTDTCMMHAENDHRDIMKYAMTIMTSPFFLFRQPLQYWTNMENVYSLNSAEHDFRYLGMLYWIIWNRMVNRLFLKLFQQIIYQAERLVLQRSARLDTT